MYWYFLFEGEFRHYADDYRYLSSSAMLYAESLELANEVLVRGLDKEGVSLLKINDFFEFDISNVDLANEDNLGWINMYEEVRRSKGYVFTPWQCYKN